MDQLLIGIKRRDVDVDDVMEWLTVDEARFRTLDQMQVVGLDGDGAEDLAMVFDDIEDMDVTMFVRNVHLVQRLADRMGVDFSNFYFNGVCLVFDPFMAMSIEYDRKDFNAETFDMWKEIASETNGWWNGTHYAWWV